jgi:ankyrin repeat protein
LKNFPIKTWYLILMDKFIKIVKDGDLEELKLLNLEEIDINADNDRAFYWACRKNRPEIAKYLIYEGERTGREINVHADNDRAFLQACKNGNKDIVELLFYLTEEYGCIKEDVLNEAIDLACINRHDDIVEYLKTIMYSENDIEKKYDDSRESHGWIWKDTYTKSDNFCDRGEEEIENRSCFDRNPLSHATYDREIKEFLTLVENGDLEKLKLTRSKYENDCIEDDILVEAIYLAGDNKEMLEYLMSMRDLNACEKKIEEDSNLAEQNLLDYNQKMKLKDSSPLFSNTNERSFTISDAAHGRTMLPCRETITWILLKECASDLLSYIVGDERERKPMPFSLDGIKGQKIVSTLEFMDEFLQLEINKWNIENRPETEIGDQVRENFLKMVNRSEKEKYLFLSKCTTALLLYMRGFRGERPFPIDSFIGQRVLCILRYIIEAASIQLDFWKTIDPVKYSDI